MIADTQTRGRHALGPWSLNPPKNYPRFSWGPHKGRYVARVVWESVAGRPLPEGWHVHHQDFDKVNFAPHNLLACPPELNPRSPLRDPYTGRYLSAHEFERRYGYYQSEEPPF